MHDCTYYAARGISLEVHPSSGPDPRIIYFDENLNVVPDGTETRVNGPGVTGNLPPGEATIVAKIAATGAPFASAKVLIQKNGLTIAFMAPEPAPH